MANFSRVLNTLRLHIPKYPQNVFRFYNPNWSKMKILEDTREVSRIGKKFSNKYPKSYSGSL